MKYIVKGRTRHNYSYDIKDEFPTLDAARTWRDQLKRQEVTMPGGHPYNGEDVLSIESYELRSYETTFVE